MITPVERLIATTFLLFTIASCKGSSSGATLVMADALAPAVTLATMGMVPGTLIHGEGVGTGGGDTCGSILRFDGWLFLSLPLSRFEFARSEEDMNSVFRVSAQIERLGTGIVDFTDPVNVDFVDPVTP